MRVALLIIIGIHGLIHLAGFVKDSSKSDNIFMPLASKILLEKGNYNVIKENVEFRFSYNGKLADMEKL